MNTDTPNGVLYGIYRDRIGDPTTHDEVRGYWVFVTGLVLGTLGGLLFLPSTSAAGTSGLTLRELSIFLGAVGLSMLVAGPVIRLRLQSWANYAAYTGQAVCFAAAVWFLLVFPADWSVQTGSQPVIVLYGAGLAIVALGGLLAPLIAGSGTDEWSDAADERAAEADERAAEADERAAEADERAAELEAEVAALRDERDRLESALDTSQAEAAASETDRADAAAELAAVYDSQARFELYRDRGDEWRWRLRHRNGNIVATSGEGYTRKRGAQTGMQSVRRNATGATTMLVEQAAALPDEGETFEPVTERTSSARFVLDETDGEHHFRLRHDNGTDIAASGRGYGSRRSARRAIESVREHAGPADYLWFDPTGFEVYRDAAGEWRWRLVHRNGNILADGGEGYTRRHDAARAVERIRDGVDDLAFEVYEDAAEEYRWRLRAGNDEIVADGGEGYATRNGAERAVERLREHAPDADVLDLGHAAFEIYEADGEHHWRLRHRNGNVLLSSVRGYDDRSGARDSIESVKRHAPAAEPEPEAADD